MLLIPAVLKLSRCATLGVFLPTKSPRTCSWCHSHAMDGVRTWVSYFLNKFNGVATGHLMTHMQAAGCNPIFYYKIILERERTDLHMVFLYFVFHICLSKVLFVNIHLGKLFTVFVL